MGYHYMYQYLILIDPSCLFDLIMIIFIWTEQDIQTLVFWLEIETYTIVYTVTIISNFILIYWSRSYIKSYIYMYI